MRDLVAAELAALTPAQRPSLVNTSPLQDLRDLDAVLAEALTEMVRALACSVEVIALRRRLSPRPSRER